MAWADDYRTGSFRGAPFRTVSHEGSGGRRAVIHEYPGRDDPTSEDMGRLSRRFALELFVAGRDYFGDRDALIAALEIKGPGLLVHPYLGQHNVVVLSYSVAESTDEGGIARFSIEFGEAGVPIAASTEDANADAAGAADAAQEDGPAEFADIFSLDGMPGFVEEAANSVMNGLSGITDAIAAASGAYGDVLSAYGKAVGFMNDLTNIVRKPLALGRAIAGLVKSTVSVAKGPPASITASTASTASAASSASAATPASTGTVASPISAFAPTRAAIAACYRIVEYTVADPVFATPARARQKANADAVLHLVRRAAMAELVTTIAQADWPSRDEAAAVRDTAAARLDDLALAAADAGEDARALVYDTLRRQIVRDIAQRIPGLPEVQQFLPRATVPALALANRLYGHGSAEAMAADIVERNAMRHPCFVPGGVSVGVLVDG